MTAHSRRDNPAGTRQGTSKSSASYLARKVIACTFPQCSTKHSCKYNLKQHIRAIHTKEKPYVCDQPGCNAHFARPWLLNRHKRSKKHGGVSTDQFHAAREDVDADANKNNGYDNGYAAYIRPEGTDLNNKVKTQHNLVPGEFNELDINTWTRLTAVPPPSNPAIYVCMDCDFDNVYLTACDLEAHYHAAHSTPNQQDCNCHMCLASSVEQGRWPAVSSDDDNSTIDPRLL